MLVAASKRWIRLSAFALRRFAYARLVVIRTFPCAARRVVNGSSGMFPVLLIHAGIFKKSGLVWTWGEGCPRRLRLAPGDLRTASDSADSDWWATAGQGGGLPSSRSAGSGRLLSGGPASIVGPHVGQRPATFTCRVQRHGHCGRSEAPPGGVQPHRMRGAAKRPCRRPADNVLGVASSNAGKAAASSRVALRVRRASVVTTAKRSKRVVTTLCGKQITAQLQADRCVGFSDGQ